MEFVRRYRWAIIFFGLGVIFTIAKIIVGPNIPEGYEKVETQNMEAVLSNAEDPVVLDLRDHQSYLQGHIMGAEWVTVKELTADYMKEKAKSFSTPIIIMSDTDKHSAKMAYKIGHTGYEQVYDFGGVENWKHLIP